MKKILIIAFASILLMTTNSFAIPILNDTGSGFIDTFDDGSSYGTYTNSGSLWFIQSGNNPGNPAFIESLEIRVEDRFGFNADDFDLFSTGVSTVRYDQGLTGTWAATSSDLISLYIVKAGTAYATYIVNPAAGTGSWSTYDLWRWGANSGADLEISHFTGFSSTDIPTPVPEPATLILLTTGLASVAVVSRRKKLHK
jgi:hypothetical protein